MTEKNVDEKILGKIQKALKTAALNSGATPEEAETAMMMAQRMMVKHGITMEDVEGADPERLAKKVVIHGYGSPVERKVWWKGQLARIIADNFRCVSYFNSWPNGKVQLRFLGVKEDVEIAIEVFTYACNVVEHHAKQYLKKRKKEAEQESGYNFKKMSLEDLEELGYEEGAGVERVRRKYGHNKEIYQMRLIMAIKDAMGISINPTALKNDFISGFVKGLADKFKEQVAKENWGLILVKDELVVREVEQMEFRTGGKSSAKGLGDSEAKQAGYKQGKQFDSAPKGKLGTGQGQID